MTEFKPKTVYVIYIASTPDKVWDALTQSAFTQQYFFGRSVEIEPRAGGSFILRMPDGRVDVKGKVVTWDPPQRLAVTWRVDWIEDMRDLPECLVSYEIALALEDPVAMLAHSGERQRDAENGKVCHRSGSGIGFRPSIHNRYDRRMTRGARCG